MGKKGGGSGLQISRVEIFLTGEGGGKNIEKERSHQAMPWAHDGQILTEEKGEG